MAVVDFPRRRQSRAAKNHRRRGLTQGDIIERARQVPQNSISENLLVQIVDCQHQLIKLMTNPTAETKQAIAADIISVDTLMARWMVEHNFVLDPEMPAGNRAPPVYSDIEGFYRKISGKD
jgi:hypothetical protein